MIQLWSPLCSISTGLCNSLEWDWVCGLGLGICMSFDFEPILAANPNINVYDITKTCDAPLCYDFTAAEK